MNKNYFIIILSILVVSGCEDEINSEQLADAMTNTAQNQSNNELNLPTEPFNYSNINLPDHYVTNSFSDQIPFQKAVIELDSTPTNNEITDAGATLGRVLFYDQSLSSTGTVSCATCHQQSHGFSDPDVLSRGVGSEFTRRHSMSLANARFNASGKYFWDERADTLEQQVLMPIQDPVEMGLTLSELEDIVASKTYYPELFSDAFGDQNITSERIASALAQFVRSMVSVNSRYDIARQEVETPTQSFPGFTEEENMGKDLFLQQRQLSNGETVTCAGCHISEAFAGAAIQRGRNITSATNNGLDSESIEDLGVFESSGDPNDVGSFRVPALANIAIRAPYMHDGRFSTLEDVVEHYSTNVQPHPNLAPPLTGRNGQALSFNFTEQEKRALVAFLNTLTDEQFINDEKYSNPFN